MNKPRSPEAYLAKFLKEFKEMWNMEISVSIVRQDLKNCTHSAKMQMEGGQKICYYCKKVVE